MTNIGSKIWIVNFVLDIGLSGIKEFRGFFIIYSEKRTKFVWVLFLTAPNNKLSAFILTFG